MTLYSYFNGDQRVNQANLIKGGTSAPSFSIDFTDALRTASATISSAASVGTGSTGATVTTIAGTTTVSGNYVIVDLKTGGAGGTGEATDGDEFRVRVTATLTSGGPVYFDTFVLISNPSYLPV
jgi:hypothetical protein